jgi:RNA polymerase sigma-32 factor
MMGKECGREYRPASHATSRTARSQDSLGRFLNEIRRYDVLDADTEATLARRWLGQRDPKAVDRLVGSHQRLVVRIAKEHQGYGLLLADLISEGNIGLMQAVEKFDPDRGFRLATYAMWWIRRAINQYIFRSFSSVKRVTTDQDKKVFFKLRGLVEKHRSTFETDLTPETVAAIADELDMAESEVRRLNCRVGPPDVSFNTPVGVDQAMEAEWQDLLADTTMDLEANVIEADEMGKRRALLPQALDVLNKRERHIITERSLREEPASLTALGDALGLTRERVRQIELRAFEKLKKRMCNTVRDAKSSARIRRNQGNVRRPTGIEPRQERIHRLAG